MKRPLAIFFTLVALEGHSEENENAFGELIFEDRFERSESQEEKDEPGNNWTTSSETTAAGHKQVDLREGAMHMHTHKDANHAVSTRQAFEFTDGTVGMRFKLDNQGDKLQLNFADLSLKSVHAGHLFDATVSLDKVYLEDKKTGFMDLKIRAANKAGTLPPEQRASLLATKRKYFPIDLKKGEWHQLLVHVEGDKITVIVNGMEAGSYQSEGFAHPTKRLLRLLVPGEATVDDVKIWGKR